MKFAFRRQIACSGCVPSIRVLSETIANQIAAGEVIERPANVVKELLENSLDAGAKHIYIQFFNGGLPLIHVSDDGCGMDEEDAQFCFKRHATGKLTRIDDLQTLTSFGFRGEALPSIASVAEVTLRTRRTENELGCEVKISTTASPVCVPCACPVGTDITVERLFYNIPVRRKFLKSEATESAHITHCVRLYALAYPQVHFELKQDGRSVFISPKSETLSERINALWPKREPLPWLPLQISRDTWKLSGVISPPRFGQATAQTLYFFLNQRPITHPNLVRALREAYRGFLPDKQYPSTFLFLEMPGTDVDINVHPTKREVRFKQDAQVCAFVSEAVRECLKNACRQPFGVAHDAPFPVRNIFPVSGNTSFYACKNESFTSEPPANFQESTENSEDIRNFSQISDAGASALNTDVLCSEETVKKEKNDINFENSTTGGFEPSKLSNNSESTSDDKEDIAHTLRDFSDKAGYNGSQSSEAMEYGRNGASFYGDAAGTSHFANPSNALSSASENKTNIWSSQNFSAETGHGLNTNTNGSQGTKAVKDSQNTANAGNDAACVAFSTQPLDVRTPPHPSEHQAVGSSFCVKTSDASVLSAALSSNSQSTSGDKGNAPCFSKKLLTADNFKPNPDIPCPSAAVADTNKPVYSEDNIHNSASQQPLPADTIPESTSGDAENTKPSRDAFDIPFFALWQNRWALFDNSSSLLVFDCKGAQLRLWYDRIASLLKQEQIGPLQTLLFPHIFSLEDRRAALFSESIDWLKFSKICIARTLNGTQFQLEALPQWVPSKQADLFIEQIAASLEYGGQMIALRYRFEPLLIRLAQRRHFEPMQNEKQVRLLCRELQTCENYVTDPLGNHIWNQIYADDLMGKRER